MGRQVSNRETKAQRYEREKRENYPYLADERYKRPGEMHGENMVNEVTLERKNRGTRSEMLNWCHACATGLYGVIKIKNNCWKFKFEDRAAAMLFKLTWGGK